MISETRNTRDIIGKHKGKEGIMSEENRGWKYKKKKMKKEKHFRKKIKKKKYTAKKKRYNE